jgi:TetR/AcrR family transcriptional regulator, copper-responsive repressor
MGRPKGFKKQDVIAKTTQLFWAQGYASTSVQDIESATGVNKSGLYSEFRDKDDLFLQCLKTYSESVGVFALLRAMPMGWDNIEKFLLAGLDHNGRKSCFVVSSIQQTGAIPSSARSFIEKHVTSVADLLEENLRAAGVDRDATTLTAMISTFNNGLCVEKNLKGSHCARQRISEFLRLIKDPQR